MTDVERQMSWMWAELRARRAEHDAIQEELESLRQDARRLEAIEPLLAQLIEERRLLQRDAERAQASRAWRLGHAITRTVGRVTRRRRGNVGALDAMVERLAKEVAVPQLEPPTALRRRDAATIDVDRIAGIDAVTIIVPIHNAAMELRRCLESLVRHTGPAGRLLLIDDASTEEAVGEVLDAYRGLEHVTVLANDANLGFTATVNRGLDASDGDVVILNSDTEVPPRWLEQLMAVAYSDAAIGTVTPVSNNAGAFSVPDIDRFNELPAGLTIEQTGRLVAQNVPRLALDAPTGSGFCLYVKRACLDTVGTFDEARFPRGYGEENDFCMRAGAVGWKHAVDNGTWVHHAREASFGDEKRTLVAAHRRVLDELYPDYTAQVRAFVASPALHDVQEASRAVLTGPRRGGPPRPRVLYVLHSGTGGVPATNDDLMRGLGDRWDCVVLSPGNGGLQLWRGSSSAPEVLASWPLDEPWRAAHETRPGYVEAVVDVLTGYGVELVHIRHLLGHPLELPRLADALAIPYLVSLHDFFLVCPTVHLLDENDRYCGGICTSTPGDCPVPALAGPVPPLKHAFVNDWRERTGPVLQGAAAVVTTSQHLVDVHRATIPGLEDTAFTVIPHGRDLRQVTDVARAPQPGGPIRILVPGNIGVHKGANLLEEVKRLDVDDRIELHFLGGLPMAYQPLGVAHGRYDRGNFQQQAREIGPAFVGLFSITAESYSHTLSEAWAAGVPVLATDLGALRERISAQGGGWLVPHDDPAEVLRRIIAIADDPADYAAQLRLARAAEPTVAEMAEAYDVLYRDALAGCRAFDASAVRTPSGPGPHRRQAAG